MKRELSKEKKNETINKKRNKNENNDNDTKSNSNSNNIYSDLFNTLKSNINNVLNGNINLNQNDNLSNNADYSLTEDYFNLKALSNKLDKNLFKKEYLDHTLQINNNLKEFNLKPKFIGVDLQKILETFDDLPLKETKKGNRSLKNTNDSSNDADKSLKLDSDKIKKLNSITDFKLITPLEIFYKHKYEKFHKISDELDKCSICLFEFYDELIEKTEKIIKNQDTVQANNISNNIKCFKTTACEEILNYQINNNFYDVVLLNECNDHFFHIDCILNMIGEEKQYAKCPNCNLIYGIMIGDQPPGTMKVYAEKKHKCDGYRKNNTLIIEYQFPNGKGYEGTSRTAYLPDNQEGREILALLRVAFERKLLFTIGTSVTTGKANQTIWNGIHQKTNLIGGAQYFGYPDPTYFNRVKNELASKGVIKEHIEKNELLSDIADKFIKEKSFSNLEEKKITYRRRK